MKFKMDIGSALLFASGIVLLIWATLKALGIINTPLIVQMVPYFTIGGAIIAAGIQFGRLLEKLSAFSGDMQELKGNVRRLDGDMRRVEKEMSFVRQGVHILENDMAFVKRKLRLA